MPSGFTLAEPILPPRYGSCFIGDGASAGASSDSPHRGARSLFPTSWRLAVRVAYCESFTRCREEAEFGQGGSGGGSAAAAGSGGLP